MKCHAVVVLAAIALSGCATDTIHPMSLVGADPTMLVNGWRGGSCQPHKIYSGSPDAKVDNYGAARGCPSEVAVFAQGNAMGLEDAVSIFTDKSDVVDVPLSPPNSVPVNIFVMPDPWGTVAAREARAGSDVTFATQAWDDENMCGITYSAVGTIYDATVVPIPVGLPDASCEGNVAPFKALAASVLAKLGRTPPSSVVNVFYTVRDPDIQGETCSDGLSAVIIISSWEGPETLAHELGHALSLCHPNDPTCYSGSPAIPADNLMNSPSAQATKLTTAQCFRANVNENSVLNQLSIRTGATRCCADAASDAASPLICPPLWMHK
jgi:hypothetical protein